MPMRQSTLAVIAAAALLAQGVIGMFADDAGKLDWHKENIGRVVSAGFDGRGGLTVVGEASSLASIDSRTGDLTWRRVLSADDTIIATSAPSAGLSTVTLSSGGRFVRLWSPVDGSLTWETALAPEAAVPENEGRFSKGVGDNEGLSGILPRVVSTGGGHVVVLSAGGIHVLSATSGAVLAQWWCDPSREPDLAALVGADAQVTFTSLRLVGGGRLLAGGWSSNKGVSDKAQAFVVAEIDPAERLVTFEAAKVTKCEVKPSAGVTLVSSTGGGTGGSLAVVGLCSTGSSLAVFGPSFDSSSVAEAPLPEGLLRGSSRTATASSVSELSGSNGSMLELRGKKDEAGSAVITLSFSTSGETNTVSVVKGNDKAKEAWSCPPPSSSDDGSRLLGCALAGGVSPSGQRFVASASIRSEQNSKRQLLVRVAQIGKEGTLIDSFQAEGLSSLGQGRPGRVQAAFLEAREGTGCVPGTGASGTGVCFRALVVNEDYSAMMLGRRGVEWVREEALASVDQVVFVDSSKDELTLLAASGQKVEHHIPGWKERRQLRWLEAMSYLGSTVKSLAGVSLPGSELLEEVSSAHAAFGLKKLAICTTKPGKLYAIDMTDGSVEWSLLLPVADEKEVVSLYSTRPKGALGYNPEVAVVSVGETYTVVSWRDALTGVETRREELGYKVASAVPVDVKDDEDRAVLMLVDSDGGMHAAPSTAQGTAALSDLLPRLFHHKFSQESGLESFVVVRKTDERGDALMSTPVAAVPLPAKARLVAKAYPDRRDAVQTPAHTLGDDSLLIKYINPRLLALATLSDPDDGSAPGKGQDLTVSVLDNVSGRILHRISHKGATEPVHMVVSESWVVYTYWSATSQRTEMSTLSMYDGMIDKYGLSPFNRPEWKEAFSSFESKVPIVMQKTFIFPHPVTALGVAVTQRGITAKDILVGTALGQVILLDRRYLDPRRPVDEPTKSEKEEKLAQYQPYLSVVPTQVLSYHKVVERVDRVLTEPTGLESTSLVLALGLDLFGSRVAPSKTYDMLDPNFNYALLVLVLVAMSAAVVVSSIVAGSKRLKDQWT